MITVDIVRNQLNIELKTLKEFADARATLEKLNYDVSTNPDDYHQWERVRQRHEVSLKRVGELEAELMRFGNR